MPNWCYGYVKVTGEPKNIERFCKYFLFYEDNKERNIVAQEKYFARSFANMTWQHFKENYLGKGVAQFGIEFAWSCHSCLVEGYPQENKDTCITLQDACKECAVSVVIETEEIGCAFEERIECDDKGMLLEECVSMPEYKCSECGETQAMPTDADLSDEMCCSCDEYPEWRKVE